MGGSMPSPRADALELIRAISSLLQEEPLVLASAEDADFFRKGTKRKVPEQIVKTPPLQPLPFPKPTPPVQPNSLAPLLSQLDIKPHQSTASEEKKASDNDSLPLKNQYPSSEIPHLCFFESLRTLFSKVAPDVAIREEIPNDAIAKKIAMRWKTKNQTAPISILSLSEPQMQKTFLEKIAKALDTYHLPCRLISAETVEKEGSWNDFLSVPELKLIISCDYTLWQLTKLMSHYKENPTTGQRTLGTIPLFLLPDLSLYLKDPLLKRSLWKALCQKLSM